MSTLFIILLAGFVFTFLIYPPVCGKRGKPWELTKEEKQECEALKKRIMNLQTFLIGGVVFAFVIGASG